MACATFRWIGQPFSSCDDCGLPYWEHTHEHKVRKEAKLFDDDMFERVPITAEAAAACKRRWGVAPSGLHLSGCDLTHEDGEPCLT